MIWLLVLSLLLNGVLGYLVYASIKKYNAVSVYCEAYIRLIGALYLKVIEVKDQLAAVDRLGAFRADDEVGFVFKEIDSMVHDLHNFIVKYVNVPDQEKEKA